MKWIVLMRIALVFALGFSVAGPATAQGTPPVGPAPGPRVTECGAARDPARCEAVVKAKQQCADFRGARKRACLEDNIPPPDCTRARNIRRCEARAAAQAACRGTIGVARRDCQRQAMRRAKK